MSRHVNIPIFIPHLGCPNQCVFCNQRTISGACEFEASSLGATVEQVLSTCREDDEVEIAFFGGSFTGIDRELMLRLLDTAYEYVRSGRVSSLRCSTRPDYIDDEILDILASRGVGVIELGLQSTSPAVLSITKRGHDLAAEEYACRKIVERGFRLVGQMMIGLPGATPESELETADFIIRSGAYGARIYPTVVLRDTELCDMTVRGEYLPLSVSEAVERSAAVFSKFAEAGVEVIRIGLCASENLSSDKTYFAGPNHPALGELVENKVYFDKIYNEALRLAIKPTDSLKITVPRGHLSKAVGQNKRNKILLGERLCISKISFVEDDRLNSYEILLQKEEIGK